MSYLTIEFSLFFVFFFILYWCLKNRIFIQNIFLLITSYVIVGITNINFALILGGYTIVTYFFSHQIYYSSAKKRYLILAIIFAILNLALFKYFNFFRNQLQSLLVQMDLSTFLPITEFFLPLGISFYTFHSISYLVSIYQKEIKPVGFWEFALFLSFFPSIIAGPINRAKEFLPQIQSLTKESVINPKNLVQKMTVYRTLPRTILEPYRAITLIILAVIKVYWLSSFLELSIVNPVFNNPDNFNTLDLLLAVYSYAIQIYLNFSGYTDLVTGIALLLGFRLPINFNLPYLAHNIREFWQRWHISLSTWIRDYIYFPLGGSKKNIYRTQINVMIAMLLSGLWHGSGENFIVWGAVHGIGVIFLNITDHFFDRERLTKFIPLLARLITFHFVCFSWIFFRCDSLDEAFEFIKALFMNLTAIELQYNSLWLISLLFILFSTYRFWSGSPRYFTLLLTKIHWSLIPLALSMLLMLVINFAPSGIPLFIYGGF